MQRKRWIDLARGICMMMILLFHTEVYYTGSEIIPYHLYVENSLAGFFFLSGYLSFHTDGSISPSTLFYKLFRKLIVPYLFFNFLIAFPKNIMNGNTDILYILFTIISGQASWFVSTLIVCKTAMTLLSILHNKWLTSACCVVPFILMSINSSAIPVPILNVSAIAIIFMEAGHLYRRWEKQIDVLSRKYIIFISVLLFIFIKIYEYKYDLKMTFYYISIDNYPLFLIDCLLGCYLLVWLTRRVDTTHPLVLAAEWTGRHSLVYYFICGGVPLVVGRYMPAYMPPHYEMVIMAFLLVYLLSSCITYTLYRIRWIRNIILGDK